MNWTAKRQLALYETSWHLVEAISKISWWTESFNSPVIIAESTYQRISRLSPSSYGQRLIDKRTFLQPYLLITFLFIYSLYSQSSLRWAWRRPPSVPSQPPQLPPPLSQWTQLLMLFQPHLLPLRFSSELILLFFLEPSSLFCSLSTFTSRPNPVRQERPVARTPSKFYRIYIL